VEGPRIEDVLEVMDVEEPRFSLFRERCAACECICEDGTGEEAMW